MLPREYKHSIIVVASRILSAAPCVPGENVLVVVSSVIKHHHLVVCRVSSSIAFLKGIFIDWVQASTSMFLYGGLIGHL